MKSVYYLQFIDLTGGQHFVDIHRKAAAMNAAKALVKMGARAVVVGDQSGKILKTWGDLP